MTNITINMLPFDQQLILMILQVGVPLLGLLLLITFLYKFMPKIMFQLYNKIGSYERDYKCQCARCKAELATKRGKKIWKRNRRFKRNEWK